MMDQWFAQIRDGKASPQLKQMAVQGRIPFPPEQMLHALAVLACDDDAKVKQQARRALGELPRDQVLARAADPGADAGVLRGILAAFLGDEEVQGRLASNPSLPDDIFVALADSRHPAVLESLAWLSDRLRKNYGALLRLIANPSLPAPLKAPLMEERERIRAAEKAPFEEMEREIEVSEVEFDEVLVKDFEEEDKAVPAIQRPQVQERRHASVYQIIRTLNAGEKLILAMKGNKEARYLLIRESNKQIATKVLESPRLSDMEVEMFAKMTNVCDEVLRGIANTKEWMGKYNIMKSLVCNPKTPMGIAIPLIPRLSVRDLGNLGKNRNVPEVIRQTAARLYRQRREQRTGQGSTG